MDDIVLKGVAKWPNVPAVYGWLALDRRGEWLLKGERICNPTVTAFIGRNYECDERGRWFFQNGPQRVYVRLEYTPLVYRVSPIHGERLELETQNGIRTNLGTGAWLDEEGALLINTDIGVGVVHDKDLPLILGALVDATGKLLDDEELESRMSVLASNADADVNLRGLATVLPLHTINSRDVAKTFGFDPQPADTTSTDRVMPGS
jgi:hypothetical protein